LQVEALAAAPLSRTPSFPSSPSSSSAVSQVPRSRESTSAHVVDPSADLAAEQVVLDAARTALERGDAAHALEEVQRHERRFPAGQLREEREGVRIAVLVAMGQKDAARAQLARFHRQFPSSLQGRALDALLGDGR
jgi:TolA-binding protein